MLQYVSLKALQIGIEIEVRGEVTYCEGGDAAFIMREILKEL